MSTRANNIRAFTLIELLIVIGIIMVMATMILAGAKALGIGSKKAKTQTILAAVRKGIELTIANKGGSVSPVEHPFAGSKAPRFEFHGVRGRTLNIDLQPIGGAITAIDTGSEAFAHIEEWFLQGSQNRCLMGDDWMVDKSIPGFYGFKREYMTILGAEMSWTTRYRRLPRPLPVQQFSKVPLSYDDLTKYPDAQFLINGSGTAADSKKSLDYLFGSSNVLPELSSLQAIYSPPDDQLIDQNYWIKVPVGTPPNDFGVVWSEKKKGSTGDPAWRAGRIYDNNLAISGNYWKGYRIRGLAIYDAWQREILYSISSSGSVRLLSAGEDGVFQWDPGPDHTLQTAEDATSPAGNDKDGARDNVKQETVE
jgi:hypothetical protein